jgi:hypothetical protein
VELASIRLGLSCSLVVARAFPCKALEIHSLHDRKVDRITKCGQGTRGGGSVVVFNGRMGFRAKRFASCRGTSQAVQRNVSWRPLPPGLAVSRPLQRRSADTNPKPVYNWILSCLGHPLNFSCLERENIKAAPHTVVPVLPNGLGLYARDPGVPMFGRSDVHISFSPAPPAVRQKMTTVCISAPVHCFRLPS